jgi:hypothetical protein
MRRFYPLKSLSYSAGGRGLVELDQLPGEHYLRGLLFHFPWSTVLPAAAFSAVASAVLNRLIDQVKIGRRISITGQSINGSSGA